MAWNCPDKYISAAEQNIIPMNDKLLEMKDELSDEEAKRTLAMFLRANLGFTTELLTGIHLANFQRIILRGFFNKNFSMCVWGRGCSKSFLGALFCILYSIFNPGAKVIIVGPQFRTARRIFDEIDRIVNSKEAGLLAEVFDVELKSRKNDENKWIVDEGYVTAIPLSGEKLRGFRASVLLLDEFFLISEQIITNVLMPFLVSPQDLRKRMKIRMREKQLVKAGKLDPAQITRFKNTSKMIALSSATYTFENLYTVYQRWIENIFGEDDELLSEENKGQVVDATYFVSQLSYEAVPEEMIDETIVKEARSGGYNNPSFMREYRALFTDGSDSFFNIEKMNKCTIPDGEEPTTKILGDSDKEYIVSIDPNSSDSPTSDFFAFCVIELDKQNGPVVVHNFGEAGAGLRRHIEYFYYLLTSFNVIMVCLDRALGPNFISACNESDLFKDGKINLKFFEFDSDLEYKDDRRAFEEMIIKAKNQYDLPSQRICFSQYFTVEFLRSSNTYLQKLINTKKVWFASKVRTNEDCLNRYLGAQIKLNFAQKKESGINERELQKRGLLDHIEDQDKWIHELKKQCSLIEVTTTARGTQRYDFPRHIRNEQGKDRPRRDNYTALLLAVWADRAYSLITKTNDAKKEIRTFTPILITPNN